jgi:thiamine-phosphate pyrophosphorylase
MTLTGKHIRSVPRFLVLTSRALLPPGRHLAETVREALTGGADGVVLRERDLAPSERAILAASVRAVVDTHRDVDGHRATFSWAHRATFSWAAPVAESPDRCGSDGVHLRADDPFPTSATTLVGRSCHTAADLVRAAEEGCDYVTISPVAATATKPAYGPPLGAAGLRALLRDAAYTSGSAPRVLALGGVTPPLVKPLLDAGAHGIAVMGEVMRSPEPRAAAAALAAEVHW